VKALASLKGRTVGEVVNDALNIWVQQTMKGVVNEKWAGLDEERRRNNEVYKRNEAQLLASNPGKYVAIAQGKVIGIFESVEEACLATRGSGAAQGIVTKIERKPRTVVDLGWSMMEQLA
jgi:hypothetical protein